MMAKFYLTSLFHFYILGNFYHQMFQQSAMNSQWLSQILHDSKYGKKACTRIEINKLQC